MLRRGMEGILARSLRVKRRWLAPRRRGATNKRHRLRLDAYARVLRVYLDAEVQRPVQLVVKVARRQQRLRHILAHRHRLAGATWIRQRGSRAETVRPPEGFLPGEKATLELGSCIVLSTVAFGLQFGRWPAWSAAVAVGGYLAWVVVYSEATVQARRRWPSRRHPALPVSWSADPAPPPPQEQRAS